jgi:hypothetical protein
MATWSIESYEKSYFFIVLIAMESSRSEALRFPRESFFVGFIWRYNGCIKSILAG